MKSMWKSLSRTLAVLGVIGATMMTSCDKQKSVSELNSTAQKAEEQTAKQAATSGKTAARGEEVTSEEDYERVFMQMVKMMDKNSLLEITTAEGGYVFTMTDRLYEPSGGSGAVCHEDDPGASLGFARCCRTYAKAHGCIKVTYSDGGGWNAYGC